MILRFFGSTGTCTFRLFTSFAPSQALDVSAICTSLKFQSGKKGSEEQKTVLGMLAKKTTEESYMHKIIHLPLCCYFSLSIFLLIF